MNIANYRTDSEKEIGGVWRDLAGGGRVKVARYGNDRFEEALQKYLREGDISPEARTQEEIEDAIRRAAADAILLDWEGIEDEKPDGTLEAVPYSREKALEYLHIRDFAEIILRFSRQQSAYRLRRDAVIAGNSQGGSNGGGSGAETQSE